MNVKTVGDCLDPTLGHPVSFYVHGGELRAAASKHDGIRHFTIRELNSDMFEYEFMELLADKTAAVVSVKEVIEKVTHSFAPAIAKAYSRELTSKKQKEKAGGKANGR